MGLFDIFSSDSGEKAAQQGYNAQASGIKDAQASLEKGQKRGIRAINTGVSQAAPLYQNLINAGNQGITQYGNLVGLNGADAANAANQASPGYQFQLSQGLDALDRQHAAAGSLNSGNGGADAIKYAEGLASQDYFNRLNALQPYFGLGQNAASGLAGTYTNAANNKANIFTGTAANLATQSNNLGNAGYQLAQNKFGAQQSADQNLWGAILGVGQLASGFI